MQERLQKIIANAGIASRRRAEELILLGEVTVNGQAISELGTKADPDLDHIKVNGKLINPKLDNLKKVYILLNKPKGYLSSLSDPENRPLVTALLPRNIPRVHPVGRLDFNTEGLLILTNDGDLTKIITSASEHVTKVYEAKVKGEPTDHALERLRAGVVIEDRKSAPVNLRKLEISDAGNTWFEIILYEGRNNQIRKMFDTIGHSVVKLRRTRIGHVTDEHLPIGKSRQLSQDEVDRFFRKASQKAASKSLLEGDLDEQKSVAKKPENTFEQKKSFGQKERFRKTNKFGQNDSSKQNNDFRQRRSSTPRPSFRQNDSSNKSDDLNQNSESRPSRPQRSFDRNPRFRQNDPSGQNNKFERKDRFRENDSSNQSFGQKTRFRQREQSENYSRQSDPRQNDSRQSDDFRQKRGYGSDSPRRPNYSRQSDSRQSDSRQSDSRQSDPRQNDSRQSDDFRQKRSYGSDSPRRPNYSRQNYSRQSDSRQSDSRQSDSRPKPSYDRKPNFRQNDPYK
ncbi:MAG: 23S rRNA pseudouridine synthase, partial [bacterium]